MKRADEIFRKDPIKSTYFGKFYEKVVRGWFNEKRVYEPLPGKPTLYWRDVDLPNEDGECAVALGEALNVITKQRDHCTADGLLRKDGAFYLWEAKNWPEWRENKKPFVQLRDKVLRMPEILATKVIYRKNSYDVSGFLFSWWSKPENVEPQLHDLSVSINTLIAPRTFRILYTYDVVKECAERHYPWYVQIIEEEKERTRKLFSDLLGE